MIVFIKQYAQLLSFSSIFYLYAVIKKDVSIVDFFWALGFCFIFFCDLINDFGKLNRKSLLLYAVLLWGLRLAIYILIRKINNPIQDPRYTELMMNWKGNYYINVFFKIFAFQGLLCFLFSKMILNNDVLNGSLKISTVNKIGILIFLVGLFIEAYSDFVLFKFLQNPLNKGKICEEFLWKYSRHPNYFGEVVVWIGIFLISYHRSFIGLLMPITLYLLIRYVSGIPFIENKRKNNPKYQEYIKRTNPIFPKLR